MSGLEIELHRDSFEGDADGSVLRGTTPAPTTTDKIIEDIKKQEDSLPPDLRLENINSFDAIMNWSASPNLQPEMTHKEEMPMTGDQPL